MAGKHLAAFLILCLSYSAAVDWDEITPLDEYVNRVDEGLPVWEKIDEYDMEELGCYAHVINFTSQRWKDETVSSQPIWFHYLLVFLPRGELTYDDAGIMFIEGGSNRGSPPGPSNEFAVILCAAAANTGAPTALLRMIPNQPIRYTDDPSDRDRTEDANIAWTWKKFIDDPSDPEILLQFPMTKAAKKALDVFSEVGEVYAEAKLDKFTVAGGSKRGWITWLLACVDRRIQVASPIVLSILDMVPSFHKHWRSLGGWTFVFEDYYDVNVTSKVDDPNTALMAKHIDPLSYKERLTMPKVMMSATGDEFFLPDDSHIFWDELPEPKHIMLVENTNHGMLFAYERLLETMQAFFLHMQKKDAEDLPVLTWTRHEYEDHGAIEITTSEEPLEVRGYWADTVDDTRRDFRWLTADGLQLILWRREDDGVDGSLEKTEEKLLEHLTLSAYRVLFHCELTWRLEIPMPESANYRGFLVNVLFEGPRAGINFEVTSEVQIIPDTFPFEQCSGDGCYGTLV